MFYVYVLLMNDRKLYIGYTNNLKRRLEEHKAGKSIYTRKHLPVRLVYCEIYLSKRDAMMREKNLKRFKSAYSNLRKRITNSLVQDFKSGD